MTIEEIGRSVEALQKEVEGLRTDTAKRFAADAADERIAAWEKKRLIVLGGILALFGLATYASLTDKVADYFARSINPRIDAEVKRKTALVSVQDPAIAEIRTQLADLRKDSAEIVSMINKVAPPDVKTTLTPPPVIPATSATNGYAFFGVRNESGQWTERYFDIEGGGDKPPQSGDHIKTTGSVNIRKGYIVYTDAGWLNSQSIGVLRSGDQVRVDEAREVVPGFWWVAFTTSQKAR
jgi:hypothetical protein